MSPSLARRSPPCGRLQQRGRRTPRAVDLAAMAHDASRYLFYPLAVVTARTRKRVAGRPCVDAAHELPITFRSAGTSLPAQTYWHVLKLVESIYQ